mmetsp:Transcript_29007/g.60227  ORF Transcript_29007/g.60227 Transcript_29007/m.60227 type:complete len:105 (-) Transcript_29007:102-416(-)
MTLRNHALFCYDVPLGFSRSRRSGFRWNCHSGIEWPRCPRSGLERADSGGSRSKGNNGVDGQGLDFQVFDHSSFAFGATEDENDPAKQHQQQQQQNSDTWMIKS